MSTEVETRHYATWVGACGAAGLLGFGLSVSGLVIGDGGGPETRIAASQMDIALSTSLSGAGPIVILGGAQGLMLQRLYAKLDRGAWVLVTIMIGMFAWAAVSAVSHFGGFSSGPAVPEQPLLWVLPFAIFFGLFAGALFGLAQSVVLKRAAEESHWWIYANAVGWAIAVPVVYGAAKLALNAVGLLEAILIGAGSGLLAGAVVGAVTGLTLFKMRPKHA